MAAQVIYKRGPHMMDKDDLISVSYIGLVEAVKAYPDYMDRNNFTFSAEGLKAYIYQRCRGAVLDYLRSSDWTPRTQRERLNELNEAGMEDGASDEELQNLTGFKLSEIRSIRSNSVKKISYLENPDPQSSEDPSNTNAGIDDKNNPESTWVNEVLNKAVDKISTLPLDVQAVLVLHYYGELELQKIAFNLGITETKTSQLHIAGVMAVRDSLRKFS